ncbi:hypothetical protein ACFC34_35540, partial [Streptomyces sp. NPDC056053]|uniref:hypothetical protein n=1 Tax=Streptomyces sp. NPDC056053 TaxID=3345696 RepID=UPI0035D543DA
MGSNVQSPYWSRRTAPQDGRNAERETHVTYEVAHRVGAPDRPTASAHGAGAQGSGDGATEATEATLEPEYRKPDRDRCHR